MTMSIRAKNIMVPGVIVLGPNDSVRKAIRTLIENKISGAPVVEERTGRMLGFVSEYDLILAAHYVGWGLDVRRAMKADVYSATEETPIEEIAEMMLKWKIRRVPVLNEKEQPVGIVSRREVLASYYDDSPPTGPPAA